MSFQNGIYVYIWFSDLKENYNQCQPKVEAEISEKNKDIYKPVNERSFKASLHHWQCCVTNCILR